MTWDGIHALVLQAKDHDPEAWQRLHALIAPFLRERAGKICKPNESMSDLTQTTWMKVVEKLGTFRGGEDDAGTSALLRAWLKTIMKHVHANQLRGGQADKRTPPDGTRPIMAPAEEEIPA